MPMTPIILLSLAYAAGVALLLNLNLVRGWRFWIKLVAVGVAALLYVATYEGLRQLMGWPTSAPMPDQFQVHWITIEEPDKQARTPGIIHYWVSGPNPPQTVRATPRAHSLPWSLADAKAAEVALKALSEGQPMNGFRTRGAVQDQESAGPQPGAEATGAADGPLFEFRPLQPTPLPAKPALDESDRSIEASQ